MLTEGVKLLSAVALSVLVLFTIGFEADAAAGSSNASTVSSSLPWYRLVVGEQSESERLATVDLQRYLGQVTGIVPEVIKAGAWKADHKPAVILGTPSNNHLLKGLGIEKQEIGEQGFYLANRSVNKAKTVLAAGLTPQGATNAVYGLLRELGYGFYMGSEAAPDSLPKALGKSPIVRKPVFRVRGVLPWYNFFNSPTTWDSIDHRAFADQLIRMGANFLGFHTYDSEPFAAYEENGKFQWGKRLLNTGAPTWGTSPLATRDFGYGTGKLFANGYFGAATTFDISDEAEAIRAEQDIMRNALDYAKRRGLHTCIGFELTGDPTKAGDREVFLKRLNLLLDRYPSVDYIWIWQSETQGAQGFSDSYSGHPLRSKLEPDSYLPAYGIDRREAFKRIVDRNAGERPFFQPNEKGAAARANEGARLEQFAQLAHNAMSHRKNPPKLVISGWGGDERLLSAEYYDGLDKLLPKDVVFSSLDHIISRTRVDAIYSELPSDRERWPIPWLEYDGDQWHPQPFVHVYESMVKDVHQSGSQGILGIHWRTRDIEENFAYLMQYSWSPGLTAEQFFRDYASRCYAPEISAEMASIHSSLDDLGYRWVRGSGQVECGAFGWGPGSDEYVQKLKSLRERAASLLPKAGKGEARLMWLLGEMDWVLRYYKAETVAVEARSLLAQAREASDAGEKRRLVKSAKDILDREELGDALWAYAKRISTRGEYGVLATINTKAYVAWRDMQKECREILGDGSAQGTVPPWNPESQILLPRFIASTPEGKHLDLHPVVLGGGRIWVHYRTMGQKNWKTLPLQTVAEWVQQVRIPSSAIKRPGLEFGFSFNAAPDSPMAYGPVTVSVLPPTKTDTVPRPILTHPGKAKLKLAVKEGKVLPLQLVWDHVSEADYYKVYRDGEFVTETSVCLFPDRPSRSTGTYKVEAWRDGRIIAAGQVSYSVPDRPFSETFDVQTRCNGAGVILMWPACRSPHVTSYRISRRAGGESVAVGEVPASMFAPHTYRDTPPEGKWTYHITPANAFGREASPVAVSVDYAVPQSIAPAVDLPLTSMPEQGELVGDVTFDQWGAGFNGGYLIFPHSDGMNLASGMTLTFEFKADAVEGFPVLLSHGLWQTDGWFVQILNGRLVVRTPSSDAVGPEVQPGKWYSVRFLYDGLYLKLEVDGQWLDQEDKLVQDVPSNRDLIIGQYDRREPMFAFNGSIRSVRLYNGVMFK